MKSLTGAEKLESQVQFREKTKGHLKVETEKTSKVSIN